MLTPKIHKIKMYITEDGYFSGEAWEIAEKVTWKEQEFTLQGIDDEGDYVYTKVAAASLRRKAAGVTG